MKVRVNPEVMRKMRAMAIRQAISEIKEGASKEQIEYIAKRHGLGYGELKQAYTRSQNERA